MKENCAECKYHDVFWKGSGCILLNSMERCKFKPIKEAQRVPEAERRMAHEHQTKNHA
jgi:hypothetical protein